MPKEIIYRSGHDPSPCDPTTRVQVGWERGGSYVEIATVQPGGQVAFKDPDTGDFLPASQADPGFFMTIDRDGINRLIRTLRRARDAAFGADA